MEESIFRTGHNCWKINKADHLSLLIDGDNYYRAFFDLAAQAKNCIEVTGWELSPELSLSKVNNDMPDNFRKFLNNLTLKNKELKIHVLVWKAFFYLRFGRERFTKLRWRLLTSPRLVYNSGKTPFFFSSYHEKVAIVDDICAFIGGMDLAEKRWDTSDHQPNNPLRKDKKGEMYPPVHDLQVVLSGAIVKDLKNVIHKRHDAVFHNHIKNLPELWPKDFPPELENVQVAIMRTDPKENAWEIKNFYEDTIRSAKKYIFIENQHMTSESLVELLCEKLRMKEGPDVIIISTLSYQGFFERAVYVDRRNKNLRKLREADNFKRLIVVYPTLASHNDSMLLTVHSKLMVIDNKFMTIGSANFNNRSMNVDNEINIGLEAIDKSDMIKVFISNCVFRILAEHLDVNKEEIIKEFESKGSVLKAILVFKGMKAKTLNDMPYVKVPLYEKLITLISAFIDINKPVAKRIWTKIPIPKVGK